MSQNKINKLLPPAEKAAHPNQSVADYGCDLNRIADSGADYLAYTISELLNRSASPLKTFSVNTEGNAYGGRIKYNLYPNGANKAVTFSIDDGKAEDAQAVEILNQHGLKGTFHLVPTWLGNNAYVNQSQVPELYSGHEVAAHGNTHSRIEEQTPSAYSADLLASQTALKALTGYDIRGYAYPFGGITNTVTPPLITIGEVKERLKAAGIVYARNTLILNNYNLPSDFLSWGMQVRVGPASTATLNAFEKAAAFKALSEQDTMQVFMVFTHANEIEGYTQNGKTNSGWDLFDELCAELSGSNGIWYASCIDIADYADAASKIRVGAKTGTVKNTGGSSVWVTLNGCITELEPGMVYLL
jgi:peptidoglycan/xylan/chitin deacetylase (PgdA/CDA1 family)